MTEIIYCPKCSCPMYNNPSSIARHMDNSHIEPVQVPDGFSVTYLPPYIPIEDDHFRAPKTVHAQPLS